MTLRDMGEKLIELARREAAPKNVSADPDSAVFV
jgi:hypothetical protein